MGDYEKWEDHMALGDGHCAIKHVDITGGVYIDITPQVHTSNELKPVLKRGMLTR